MQLEIKGQKIGLKFNQWMFEELLKMPQIKSFLIANPDLEKSNGSGFSMCLIFSAYRGWCYLKGIEEELTLEDISDWLDTAINDPAVSEKIAEVTAEYQKSQLHIFTQKKSQLNGQLTGQLLPEESEK
jgi:hypothetical protein